METNFALKDLIYLSERERALIAYYFIALIVVVQRSAVQVEVLIRSNKIKKNLDWPNSKNLITKISFLLLLSVRPDPNKHYQTPSGSDASKIDFTKRIGLDDFLLKSKMGKIFMCQYFFRIELWLICQNETCPAWMHWWTTENCFAPGLIALSISKSYKRIYSLSSAFQSHIWEYIHS